MRNVVENCEGETRENEPEKEEETDDGFVNVAIFDVAQTVPRDVVSQADGGDGDEGLPNVPALLLPSLVYHEVVLGIGGGWWPPKCQGWAPGTQCRG